MQSDRARSTRQTALATISEEKGYGVHIPAGVEAALAVA